MTAEYLKLSAALISFSVILWGLLTSARHFIGWFQNSTPPRGIFGQVFEVYTMFFNRYLTKEGIDHKNKFIRWFFVTIFMAGLWAVSVFLMKNTT